MKKCLLCLVLVLVACGSDEEPPVECAPGEQLNPVSGECLRVQTTPRDMGSEDDTEVEVGTSEDVAVDLPPVDMGCQIDEDGDGQAPLSCGGLDCDDTTGVIYDGAPETCDAFDNNCDGNINEGIDCSFFAHSDTRLYRINPFSLTLEDVGSVPNLFDIDTHPDGTLYGITSDRLHRYDGQTWIPAAQSLGLAGGDFANGMAIDNSGTIFITTKDTLSSVNIATGSSTEIGDIGPSSSSGDCVVNKGDQLFMTSDHTDPDTLVTLDGMTGTPGTVGQTASTNIWALTAAWGQMYGLTGDGRLIQIDETTGASLELHQFQAIQFFGAASTPSR